MCESMIDPLASRKQKCIDNINFKVDEGLVGGGYRSCIELVENIADEHTMQMAEFCFSN